MISIIMLTHNAPAFVRHSILTLKKNTEGVVYELIILDNNSDIKTRRLLLKLQKRGYIDKIIFEKKNTLFAKGNNTASLLCSSKSKYILLLNSDVEIRDRSWLKYLLNLHERGAISYGVCDGEPHVRADGYCFLIDKDLYLHYKLDEEFEWWWSVTKLQAQLLRDHYKVKAIKTHNSQIFHFGGMSGTAWKNSKGMEVEGREVKAWFDNYIVEIIPSVQYKETVYTDSVFARSVQIRKKWNGWIKTIKNLINFVSE